jgi:acyl-CoA synthetase (AMP-forming)/AMP-acid ligase II
MNINFGQLMLQTARQFRDREALVNVERNRRFTFMELHLLTNRISNMMRDRFGLGFGDIYINLAENDNCSLVNMWMLKGAVTGAWLNYRDSYEEHVRQIEKVKPKLAFVEVDLVEKYYPLLHGMGCEVVSMDDPSEEKEGLHYFWDLVDEASDAETGIEYDIDEHLPLFRFTGGTTGKGKCAMYTAGNILAGAQQFHGDPANSLRSGMRHVHVTPVTHGAGVFILPVFFKGGTNLTQNLPDLKTFCETVQKEKLTSTLLIPTLLYLFLETDFHTQYDLSTLETVYYGAAPMSPDKLVALKEKFGNIFLQGYGSTEAWPMITLLSQEEHEGDPKWLGSAGSPMPGVEIKIMDDDGNEVPIGDTGEIWMRSRPVVQGFFDNPEQTAEEFQDGYWKSGDMGYIDDAGRIYIVDRKKDMIITGGFNVYAIEVEAALNAHPDVLMSAVVGVPHEKWGEAIQAEVVLKEGAKLSEEDLIAFCKEKTSKYKAPKAIAFVEELPTSGVGKVLRREVRQKYWAGKERSVS